MGTQKESDLQIIDKKLTDLASLIEYLVESKCDVNLNAHMLLKQKDHSQNTSIFVGKGLTSETLMDKIPDKYSPSPLMLAVTRNTKQSEALVEFLIKHKADINY